MEETPGRASLEKLGCRTPPQLHAGGVGRQQQQKGRSSNLGYQCVMRHCIKGRCQVYGHTHCTVRWFPLVEACLDVCCEHQTNTACSRLVCHSRGDCANCIHIPRISGGPATLFLWEASRASPQHGWRSAYSLRETLSPIQDQNQHQTTYWTSGCLPKEWCLCWTGGRDA